MLGDILCIYGDIGNLFGIHLMACTDCGMCWFTPKELDWYVREVIGSSLRVGSIYEE